MIALAFSFPAGRYHATPWGRHANEADVAWPPEPVRILRGLIATWWRKADHARFPKSMLDDLIDVLASELPLFHLPHAVHTHVRAYMPAPAYPKKLIYDSFLRFDRDAELIVAWRGTTLDPEQKALCSDLVERIGYLGRTESWVCGRIADTWDGEFNSCPRTPNHIPDGKVPVDIAVPLTPKTWVELRTRLLQSANGLKEMKSHIVKATLPERLSAALSVDTSEWQRAGWSSPPPLRKQVYDRPPVGPVPSFASHWRPVSGEQPGKPEVARFVLAGRPRPRVEEALRIGELARAALMSGSGNPPREFSGRNVGGPQRDDPAHGHAFFLPEDAGDSGEIDHLIVFCRHGFSAEARRRLDRLHTLWLAHGRAGEEGERGRKEWRVALEDIASPNVFGKASKLVRSSRVWTSVTPYLMPWHTKPNFGVIEQITREVKERGCFHAIAHVSILDQANLSKRAVRFQRIRTRRGLVQPDRRGSFLKLTFAEPIVGPLALGFGCHYGLGLFRAASEDVPAS